MAYLTSSGAYVRMFIMVSAGDHITPITGLSPTVLISKAGAAFAAAVGAVAEVGSGFYKVSLNSSDTTTFGDLSYHCIASTADPSDFTDQVVLFDTTNGKTLGLTYLDTNVLSRLGVSNTAANWSLLDIDTSGQIDISKVKGSVINSLISGRVDVNVGVNSDKSGYSLTQTFPTNFSSLSIDTSGEVDISKWKGTVVNNLIAGRVDGSVGVNNDKTGYSLTAGQLFVKKNAQLNNLAFVMLNSANHVATTGLTVASLYSVDGAAFSATSSAVVEMSSGWYKINLAATELNGTVVGLHFSAPLADDRNLTIITQA